MAEPSSLTAPQLSFDASELCAEEQRQILEVQHSILRMVVQESDDQIIFTELCNLAESLLPNAVASIMMQNAETGAMDVLCAPSVPPEGITQLNGLVPGPTGGSCGNAVYNNEATFVVDALNDPRCGDTEEVFRNFGLCACWSHPIRDSQGRSIGSFALSSFEMRSPGDFHKQLLAIGAYMIGIILQRSDQRRQLEYMAYNDPLTGLDNRTSLFIQAHTAISAAQQTQKKFALLYIDLNRFKNLNDTFGHSVGDEVLILIAQRLQTVLRERDVFARVGGDEFVLLLMDVESREEIEEQARKLLRLLDQPIKYHGHSFLINGSIGIAVYPDHGDSTEELLKHADIAMYQAKRSSGLGLKFFEQQFSDRTEKKFGIENELRNALSNDQFQLYYQTQVDAVSKRVVGMEALIRWNSPAEGLVSPADFIPIAEETGLIVPVGEWVLQQALKEFQTFIENGQEDLSVSINLSGVQFSDGDFDQLLGIIESSPIPNHCIELEITETFLVEEAESTAEQLEKLKRSGIKLAIDDFGIGYSSLAYLKRFKVNTLKIDRMLINDITEDPDDLAIVKAVVAMGHSLGLSVVAEGVETEEQAQILRAMDCDRLQGFLFSRPQPIEQISTTDS